MLPVNAMEIIFQKMDLLGNVVLFTNERIDKDSLPDGIYVYEVRECGDAITLEEFVFVDYFGTVLSKEHIDLGELLCLQIEDEDYEYLCEEDVSLEEFLR